MNGDYSEDLKDLLLIEHKEKVVKKGSFLFREGDLADSIFYIRSGRVRIGKITPDGREITFRICSEGDYISEIRLFCKLSTYRVQAKVIEDCSLVKIGKQDLEEKLLLDTSLTVGFLKMMGTQQQQTQSKFRDLVLHGKKGALYSTLIRMTNSYGIEKNDGILIDLPLTNQELANFCGMSREVVNRLLNSLKNDGIIKMDNGKIFVHNLQYLKDEIHCENCPVDICRMD
ncbi:Crp/Fnr family transcriptional regulator [Siminovitchia terrae]|uniref:Crp/Fnr family transcriptional regulator n=1 Tax=Siminovitchia terrae TaxID=1914933 RepID=A0A429X3W1_SIMTE|nr:Crp/Fnr family transcriptional regulator [Siminovitchia terrae]RST58077.1 Crp/Fnr family transcriptional regulator [Siminovitchia terrae]GIN91579.1 Crp/Fnr family transcriptional regulator [Siminovitchia terrae]GIN95669.1 Crp/Fnr family transcriptional regulator [Siminovitchia terrae]